ncbi:MAG TPA: HAMP domain-containing sensor histidine kinase [Acidimicrobiales bacterium]|nr:HAMP domain-containing sensor histidine kinase [Acidimicrobiales bacterium]
MSDRGGHRPRLPQTVRARLAVVYGGLFLLSGSLLLGLTYGLVARELPNTHSTGKPTPAQLKKIDVTCKYRANTVPSKGGKATQQNFNKCENAYLAGIRNGATDQRAATLNTLLEVALIGLGVATVLSGALGFLLAGRVLRPVRSITEAARRASHEHLGERLALGGPADELKRLGDTFDEMLDRLDTAFTNQRAFVANASHELRTPLTVMRTAIDVTLGKADRTPEQLEQMAGKVRDALAQAELLIEALLVLARAGGITAGDEPFDLAVAAEDAVDAAAARVRERGLTVEADYAPAAVVGDRVLLERAVANLVENATRYGDSGGHVRVRTGSEATLAFVEVENTGAGIHPATLPALFEPFHRGEGRTAGTEGTGLGLAIVRAVATAHSGRVEAEAPASGGFGIRFELPIAASPPAGP